MRRRAGLVGVLAVGVTLLAASISLAFRSGELFGEDQGGFIAFLASIGLLAMTSLAVGVLISWRVVDNRIGALLIAGGLLVLTVFTCWPLTVMLSVEPDSGPAAGFAALPANVLLLPAIFVLFPTVGLLFPDGRLPGAGWRWPFRLAVAGQVVGAALQAIAPFDPNLGVPVSNPLALPGVPAEVSQAGAGIAFLSLIAGFVLAIAGIIVRFRRSAGTERAQMKWLLTALALFTVTFPISFGTDLGDVMPIIDIASVLIGALVPLAIGLAITRYRLYDIDRIISRTVGWALVTGVLVAVFAGLVIGLQALLDDVTQGDTLAVAGSTLTAFALFQPLRRRVQSAVDLRFDRARYDAQRTADAFSERVRDEVDLDRLVGALRGAVDGAVRPSAIGVWMPTRSHR